MTIDHKPHNLKYKININVTENYKEIVINKVDMIRPSNLNCRETMN